MRVHQAAAVRHSAVKAARCEATRLLRWLADQSRYSGTGQTARPDDKVRTFPVHQEAVQHSTFSQWRPYRRCVARSSPFISTGLPTWTSQPGICIGFSACWCSWLRWYDGEDFVLRPVPVWAATAWCQRTGSWSDRIQVPQWVLSEVPGGHLQQSGIKSRTLRTKYGGRNWTPGRPKMSYLHFRKNEALKRLIFSSIFLVRALNDP